jgi:hypothetical protein
MTLSSSLPAKIVFGLSGLFAHLSHFYINIAMIKKSPIALAALLVALGTASIAVTPAVAQAQTAENKDKAKLEVIRNEWSKPYTEIQKLIGEKQYAAALEKVAALEAAEKKTPYETFFISRTKAAIASGMGDNALLAKCFEEMIVVSFCQQPISCVLLKQWQALSTILNSTRMLKFGLSVIWKRIQTTS